MDELKTYVITCNDSVEHVVIGTTEEAESKKLELSEGYFNRNFRHQESYITYSNRFLWSARPVPHVCGDGVAVFRP